MMSRNGDSFTNRLDGPVKWIQIDDTVVPVVQRRRQDDGRVYDMLPWPVIKYGVNVPCQLGPPLSPATPAECRHLSELCEEAGFEFHFSEGTELIQLADFLRSYGDRVCLFALPCHEPFRHLKIPNEDQYAPLTSCAPRRDFNDPDEQPVDLSTHGENCWTISRDLEEAVSVINDPHNKLCYKIRHKASIRCIKGQKILCLEQNNRQYVTLQKLYTAFFSRLSVAVFSGIIQLLGVPLIDLPFGYRNIGDSIPEKMVSADDVPMAIDRLEAEINRIQRLSRQRRSIPATGTSSDGSISSNRKERKDCNMQGQATNNAFGSAVQRNKADDRNVGDLLVNKRCLWDIAQEKGRGQDFINCNERVLAVTDKNIACRHDGSDTDQVYDTKPAKIVSEGVKNNGNHPDGCDKSGVGANEGECSLKGEELRVDTAKNKEQGLGDCPASAGQHPDCSATANRTHLDDACNQPTEEASPLGLNDSGTEREKRSNSGCRGKELIKSYRQGVRGSNSKQQTNNRRNNLDKTVTEGTPPKEVRKQHLEVSRSQSDTINKNCEQNVDGYHRQSISPRAGPTYDKGKRLLEKISQIRRKKLKCT